MSKLDYFKAKTEATLSPMDYMQASKANPDTFVLIDVRNAPPQIMKQKIAGALHIPLSQLAERLSEISKDMPTSTRSDCAAAIRSFISVSLSLPLTRSASFISSSSATTFIPPYHVNGFIY
jgi:rhodanese-related sulfurtransferase